MDIERIKTEPDMVKRVEFIARDLYWGMKRRNEKPAISHPFKLANRGAKCLKESRYRESTAALYWLHDLIEDIEDFDIEQLGYLLRDFGTKGRHTAYMTNRITKGVGESEEKYVIRILNMAESGVYRDLDCHTLLAKIIDRRLGIDAKHQMGLKKNIARYRKLKGQPQEVIAEFYEEHGISDYFDHKKEYSVEDDIANFRQIREKDFKRRNSANANLNLTMYLPLAEEELLVKPGIQRGSFDESKAMDNPFFNYKEVRKVIRECYKISLDMMEHDPSWGPGPRMRGYKPVLEEIGERYKDIGDKLYL